jgi:Methionine biosynthesis protein MetW
VRPESSSTPAAGAGALEATAESAESANGDIHSAYLVGVMGEIDAEVRRRRASGDIPPGLERELDELFFEFSPVGLHGKARLRDTLTLVDSAAYIDIAVPVASEKLVGSQVKRLIRTSISWYMGFIVHQVVKFAWATSRMFHVVVDHLDDLETTVEAQRLPGLPDTLAPTVDPGSAWWSDPAVAALASVRGRVLHADCGDGALLDRLITAGVDAYGVDPADQLVETAAGRDLDVRAESCLEHLEVVGEEELAGVVLSGSVQWLSPNRRHRLVGLLSSRLAVGGVLVLHSATPEHWMMAASPMVLDLAPGRPLHSETWAHLLAARGFAPPQVTLGGGERRLDPVPEGMAGSEPINQAIDVVNQLLLGPNEYLLVTVRER